MKLLIVALALLMMAQTVMTQEYETVSHADLQKKETLLMRELSGLGSAYVIQKGMFVNTKNPLNGDSFSTRFEKYEKRVTPLTTDFRYTVLLTDAYNLTVARATYVVNYRHSNGNCIVSPYSYKILKNNPHFVRNMRGAYVYDVRGLNAGNDKLSNSLNTAIDLIVPHAISKGNLPNAKYSIKYVYDAVYQEPGHFFFVKLVNNKGHYYRLRIFWNSLQDDGVTPAYVLDINR